MKQIVRTRAAPEPEEEQDEIDFSDNIVDGSCAGIVKRYAQRAKTPLKAIRAFCVACMGGYVREVSRCTAKTCVLYPYRLGHNPNHGEGTKVIKLKTKD